MPEEIPMRRLDQRRARSDFSFDYIDADMAKEYLLKPIGKKGNVIIWYHKSYSGAKIYITTSSPTDEKAKVIGQIYFKIKKKAGRKIHYVDLSVTDPKYGGSNLMPTVYRMLMKSEPNFMIQAGTLQSKGGQGIWNKLADFPDVQLFAVAQKSDDIIEVEKGEDGRLVDADGKVDLYRSGGVKIYAQAK